MLASALAAVAVAAVALRVVPNIPAFHEARFSRMGLRDLARGQEAHADDPIFLYYFGKRLNEAGQYATALPVLARAAGIDPDAARVRDEWARALLASGHVSEAFGELRQYEGTHPRSAQAHLLVGKFYATEQNYEAARIALEASVKRGLDTAEVWSLLAHVRIKLGNNGGAQEALARALRLRPDSADDHLQLAVLLTAGDPARARREYARAVDLAPRNATCRREFSRFLLNVGDTSAAEREARAAVALDGSDSLARLMVGRCLLAEGRAREAVPFLEQSAQLGPTDPLPAGELRRAYALLGDRAQAARWSARFQQLTSGVSERRRLDDATIAHPEDAAAHRRYAAALAQIGDVNGCVRQHAMELHCRPDSPPALVAAARDLDRCGSSALALPLLRQATAGPGNSPEAFEALGDTLAHLGRVHEAAVDYDRLRDWRPERRKLYQQRLRDAAARVAAGTSPVEQILRCALQTSDPDAAMALLNEARAQEPGNTRCLHALLRLQFARGKRDAAADTARALCALAPEDGLAHALLVIIQLDATKGQNVTDTDARPLEQHLQAARADSSAAPTMLYAAGLLALRRGRAQEAVRSLEQALRLDPNGIGVYPALAEARALAGDPAGARLATAEFDRRRAEMERVQQLARGVRQQ